jgi:hypothetical protein
MGYYTIWLAPVKSFLVPFWELWKKRSDDHGADSKGEWRSEIKGIPDRHPGLLVTDDIAFAAALFARFPTTLTTTNWAGFHSRSHREMTSVRYDAAFSRAQALFGRTILVQAAAAPITQF